MTSNVGKGSYYKARSKRWLEARGYEVGFMERMMLIYVRPKDADGRRVGEPRPMPIKQDQFGADLIAIRADAVVFVQVKFGRKHVPQAVQEFLKHPFPACAGRVIHVWERGARDPEIIDAAIQSGDRVPAAVALPLARRLRFSSRRRRPPTGLF